MKQLEAWRERIAGLAPTYEAWWSGALDRPVVPMLVSCDGDRSPFEAPVSQAEVAAEIDAAVYVERWQAKLDATIYLGDAFPHISLRAFGPVAGAAFLGARVVTQNELIWYRYDNAPPPPELHFELDRDNLWLERVLAVVRAAADRWGDSVVIATPELGGVMDILEVIYGADSLILHLIDYPDDMLRIAREIEELWHEWYRVIDDARGSAHAGYTDFSGIYSATPSYSLYSDFSALLSPGLFETFVAPELARSAARLSKSIYHLDGPDQIKHLPSIYPIDKLNAIQWVPGAGAAPAEEWLDLYREIRAAGKRCQVLAFGDANRLPQTAELIRTAVGSLAGFHFLGGWAPDEASGRRTLADLGVPT